MSDRQRHLAELLFSLLPADGSNVGNAALLIQLQKSAQAQGLRAGEADFQAARQLLVDAGRAIKGKGRGGFSARSAVADGADATSEFSLGVWAAEICESAALV